MRIALVLLLIWVAGQANSQPVQDLFDDLSPLQLTLRTDLVQLWGQRNQGAPEVQAYISYKDGKLKETFEAKVRVGGNFRRDPNNCMYPPLRIDARATTVTGTMFSRQGTLKLVSVCTEEAYVFKEYLAYRLYNCITDTSIRVRLCKTTFQDVLKRRPPVVVWGFLVEGPKHFGRRTDLTYKKIERGPEETELVERPWLRLCLFQYLIGNTDWDLKLMKNIHLYQKGEQQFMLPFDYDFSEWVDAEYTGLRGDSSFVRRIFAGHCRDTANLSAAIRDVLAAAPAMRAEVRDFKLLPAADRKHLLAYMESFFLELETATRPESPFLPE